MKTLTAKDAKYRFGNLIDLARAEPVVIAKHGRPAVVVLAVEGFEQLKAMEAATQPPSLSDVTRRQRNLTKEDFTMRQVIIENPVINSPFDEPWRHFRFDEEGITNDIRRAMEGRRPRREARDSPEGALSHCVSLRASDITRREPEGARGTWMSRGAILRAAAQSIEERRKSSYFLPIAQPRNKQLQFDTEWTKDRIEESKVVNRIRQRVGLWREGGYLGVTPTTNKLFEYWTKPERQRKLFFCQIEALETTIYIAEVANKYGDPWIENQLREANDQSNPGLRMALKMATGSGKTVVMAMLIAWQTLNKLADPQDARFSDTFLIITPGITIRDRLRVLLPNDPENYYRQRDILPGYLLEQLSQAMVLITNFHAFKLREKVSAGKLTKAILAEGNDGAFTETADQMVRRVCRELGHKKNIIVFNDEAHHCYRRICGGQGVREYSLRGDRLTPTSALGSQCRLQGGCRLEGVQQGATYEKGCPRRVVPRKRWPLRLVQHQRGDAASDSCNFYGAQRQCVRVAWGLPRLLSPSPAY
jgi:prevent-host-death family protein